MTYVRFAIFMLRDTPEAHDACCKIAITLIIASVLIVEKVTERRAATAQREKARAVWGSGASAGQSACYRGGLDLNLRARHHQMQMTASRNAAAAR
jgi:hypothetical protein